MRLRREPPNQRQERFESLIFTSVSPRAAQAPVLASSLTFMIWSSLRSKRGLLTPVARNVGGSTRRRCCRRNWQILPSGDREGDSPKSPRCLDYTRICPSTAVS